MHTTDITPVNENFSIVQSSVLVELSKMHYLDMPWPEGSKCLKKVIPICHQIVLSVI